MNLPHYIRILVLWGLQTVCFTSIAMEMEMGPAQLVATVMENVPAGVNHDAALGVFLQAAVMMQQPANKIIEGATLLFQQGVTGNATLESTTNLPIRAGFPPITRQIPILRDFIRQCAREERVMIPTAVRLEVIRLCLQHGADVNNCAGETIDSHPDVTAEDMEIVRSSLLIPQHATTPLLVDYLHHLRRENGTYRPLNFELVHMLVNAGYNLSTVFDGKTILEMAQEALSQDKDNEGIAELVGLLLDKAEQI